MRCPVMFLTAVCLIFLLKLKWPKNKSVYDLMMKMMKMMMMMMMMMHQKNKSGD